MKESAQISVRDFFADQLFWIRKETIRRRRGKERVSDNELSELAKGILENRGNSNIARLESRMKNEQEDLRVTKEKLSDLRLTYDSIRNRRNRRNRLNRILELSFHDLQSCIRERNKIENSLKIAYETLENKREAFKIAKSRIFMHNRTVEGRCMKSEECIQIMRKARKFNQQEISMKAQITLQILKEYISHKVDLAYKEKNNSDLINNNATLEKQLEYYAVSSKEQDLKIVQLSKHLQMCNEDNEKFLELIEKTKNLTDYNKYLYTSNLHVLDLTSRVPIIQSQRIEALNSKLKQVKSHHKSAITQKLYRIHLLKSWNYFKQGISVSKLYCVSFHDLCVETCESISIIQELSPTNSFERTLQVESFNQKLLRKSEKMNSDLFDSLFV